jgi:hypothetical protein
MNGQTIDDVHTYLGTHRVHSDQLLRHVACLSTVEHVSSMSAIAQIAPKVATWNAYENPR